MSSLNPLSSLNSPSSPSSAPNRANPSSEVDPKIQKVSQTVLTAETSAADSKENQETRIAGDGTIFKGTFVKGELEGEGEEMLPDGSYYKGNYHKGEYHGKGELYQKGEYCYTGNFIKGDPSGKGRMVLANGVIHEGNFKEGFLHGEGSVTLPQGHFVEGSFIGGVVHGMGKSSQKDVYTYEGMFCQGRILGEGKMVMNDGMVLEGSFKDGKLEGEGKISLPGGQFAEGNFKNSILDSKGKIYVKNEFEYEGEVSKNYITGQGKMIMKDGTVLEGCFLDKKLHGNGKITRPNGTVEEGVFEHGKLKVTAYAKTLKTIRDLYNEKKFDEFWAHMNKLGPKKWDSDLWTTALLAALDERDINKVTQLYNDIPKGLKSLPVCHLALAFIFIHKNEASKAKANLQKAKEAYGHLPVYVRMEAESFPKISAAAAAALPEGPSSSGSSSGPLREKTTASLSSSFQQESVVKPLTKNQRKKLAEQKTKEKTHGSASQDPVETSEELKKSSISFDEDDPKVIPVRDEKEVVQILNELVKRLPILFKGERAGAHRTLVYTVDGKEYPIPLFAPHGNQDEYARGTGRSIRKALLNLEKAGETHQKNLQVIKRAETTVSQEGDLKPLTSQQLLLMAINSKPNGRLARSVSKAASLLSRK